MKKRKRIQKEKRKKINRRTGRLSPVMTFLLTLSAVLFVGLTIMLCFGTVSGNKNGQAKEEEGFHFFWESIPEETETMTETDGSRYGALLADPEYMAENHIYAMPARKEGIVTLGFVGDLLFDDEYAVMANLLRRGVTIENGISEPLLAGMQEADILMANNEFAFTERGTPLEGKTYTFRADLSTAGYLNDMGVDLVSLANNHCYDFGEMGLLDTLDTLSENGIPYVGAGRNLEEASAPVYFISNDIKIAFVSATQIERLDNPDTKGAGEASPGVFRCWDPALLYETVKEAKENSDFVVVYIHWGTENETKPDWAQLEQAPKLAEAGADLIIGDHPHCLQGIQYFGEVPVVYSLGNFWFNSKTVDTCMIQADISKDGLMELRFIPAIQADCRTDFAYGAERERIISYMESISYGVSIDGEGRVQKKHS